MKVQKCIQGTEMSLQVLLPKAGQRENWRVAAGEVDGGQAAWRNLTRLWYLGFILLMGKIPRGILSRECRDLLNNVIS